MNARWRLATLTDVTELTESSLGSVPMFRGKAEQKLLEHGLDPARLPPGQYLTEKWPVLHAGDVPQTDLATWDFTIFGEVEEPLRLSWDEFTALPRTESSPRGKTAWRNAQAPNTPGTLSSEAVPGPRAWAVRPG